MQFHSPRLLLLPILCVPACLSCVVLEDRTGCPCYLTIDLPDDYERLYISISSGDGFNLTDSVLCSSGNQGYAIAVPRGSLLCSIADGDDWTVPPGEEFPDLNFAVDEIDSDVEELSLKPTLHKQYCRMTIVMDCTGKGPPGMIVRGDVCGYDASGRPCPGDFLCRPSSFSIGGNGLKSSCSLRVPRQLGPTLLLDVEMLSNTMTVPIGLYLEEAGYDWNELDLQDVTLEINSREALVAVATNKWRKSLSFDLVI